MPGTSNERDRWHLELLALQLDLHGPQAATIANCRPLGRSPLVIEARNLLRQYGLEPGEIAYLLGVRHPQDCACWQCVTALNLAVRRRPWRWRKTRLRLDR